MTAGPRNPKPTDAPDVPRDVPGPGGLPEGDPGELRADPGEGDEDPSTQAGPRLTLEAGGLAKRRLASSHARSTARPLAPFLQDLLQQIRPVRHDPVHAEIQQAAHLGGLVDGPHMDHQAEACARAG